MDNVSTAQFIGFALAISVPSRTALIGILINNGRLSDLRSDMSARFEQVNQRFEQVNQRFDQTEALFTEKLRRVEEVLDARLTRIENVLRLR